MARAHAPLARVEARAVVDVREVVEHLLDLGDRGLAQAFLHAAAFSEGKCEFRKYENLLNAHLAKFEFAIRRVFRKYARTQAPERSACP